MKKLTLLLCSMTLALCFMISAAASDDMDVTDDMTQGITIGVAVYNPDDAQTKAFRSYYENYLGEAFNAKFIYSNAITTWEEEKAFVDELHELGVKGIISSQSVDREAVIKLCEEYGMYYIFGSSSLSDEVFDAIKDSPSFLGTIGASDESEEQAGAGMAEFFAAEDFSKEHSYLICSGGAGMGNEMHRIRGLAMLETLAEIYGFTYEVPAEELIVSAEVVEAANDAGVKIIVLPGWPYMCTLEEEAARQIADGSIDTVMSTMVANTLIDPIREAEQANKINIRVGAVDCFTEDTYEYFNGIYSGGVPEMDYLVGKYGACVAPAFAAICNAYAGDAESFRDNGEAFQLTQGFWTATNADEFNELYALSVGMYDNTYSAADIMQVLKEFNPDATFEDFKAFAER